MSDLDEPRDTVLVVDDDEELRDCGSSLGIQVVAEGVETPSEHAALSRLGLRLFQGHHFARPQRAFVNPWVG